MDGRLAAPRFHRTKLGDFDLTVVSDGARPIPLPPRFVLNVTNEEVLAVAEAAGMPKDEVVGPFNPMVVDTGSKRILIDTGYGPLSPTVGRLPQSLALAGIDPTSIDVVLISHMHGDHINGIRTAQGALAFPNAEIKVPAVDWNFWMSDDNMTKSPDGFIKWSFGLTRTVFSDIKDRVTRFDWDREVAPGVTAVETAGHTPGHTSFVIHSGAHTLFFQADVSNVPDLFVRHPEWQLAFDTDPERAVATRRRIYDMAVTERMFMAGYHFPFPGFGFIERAGSGYRVTSAT
jgi:glyoxylase-like metal-dependent hydrolase (beta-lactamase superfamily II)